MDPVATTLFLLGLILLAFEIIIPGGILGFIGGCCMLAASIDVWIKHGSTWGILAVFGCLLAALIFFFIEIRLLKSGPIARRFRLNKQTAATSNKSAEGIGPESTGTAATRLNPTGLVLIDGKRLEAISRDGLIEEGAKIEVVSDDPFRLVVKRAR